MLKRFAIHPGDFVHALMLALAGIPILCAELGRATGLTDLFAWLPLALAFIVVPAVSGLDGTTDESADAGLSPLLCRVLPLIAVPAQLCSLWISASYWCSADLGVAGRIGWLLSGGLFSALLAASVAHELIHREWLADRTFGGVLLSTICFGSFKIIHLHIHHRFVATPRDCASAPRGLSLYRFLPRCLIGNAREALRIERTRLTRKNRGLWRSELTLWFALSTFWTVVAFAGFGWSGVAYFLMQSLLARIAVDWTNYLQHYGLRRRQRPDGRFEPVEPRHAWSIRCRISNLALLNLLRHGDHHARPDKPYQILSHEGSPTYPYPLGIMFLLALVTPLFQRVVHPLLDRIETGE